MSLTSESKDGSEDDYLFRDLETRFGIQVQSHVGNTVKYETAIDAYTMRIPTHTSVKSNFDYQFLRSVCDLF